jgi:hypothetical protein
MLLTGATQSKAYRRYYEKRVFWTQGYLRYTGELDQLILTQALTSQNSPTISSSFIKIR